MHDKSKLYRARSGYIRAITITFTLIVILPLCGAVRFNLSAWRRSPPRPHSRTCSSPYSIRAVSLPHTSRSPQCCLNDSCNLLFMVVFGLISSAFTPTPHRVPIRTGYTEFVLSQHKAHFIARAVKRRRFIHIPLEQTYSIPHFRFSQTRHKLVTNSLLQTYNHTCKNAFSPLSVQTSSYSFNMNVCTTRLHTSTRVAIQFNIQPNNSIIASDKVH